MKKRKAGKGKKKLYIFRLHTEFKLSENGVGTFSLFLCQQEWEVRERRRAGRGGENSEEREAREPVGETKRKHYFS